MSRRADDSHDDEPHGGTLSVDEANHLWDAYRSGIEPDSIAAIDRLYRSLRRPLVEFCKLKGCDPELADELAEAAWVRLMCKDRKPRATRSFIALLRKTAQNLHFDALEARRKSIAFQQDHPEAEDPVEVAEWSDTVQAVRVCLSGLDPEDRAFFVYIHVHGLSRKAACELLGWRIAPSTCHQRHEQIRAALARCLKNKIVL